MMSESQKCPRNLKVVILFIMDGYRYSLLPFLEGMIGAGLGRGVILLTPSRVMSCVPSILLLVASTYPSHLLVLVGAIPGKRRLLVIPESSSSPLLLLLLGNSCLTCSSSGSISSSNLLVCQFHCQLAVVRSCQNCGISTHSRI